MKNSILYQTSTGLAKWFSLNKNKANHFFALMALIVTLCFIFQDYLFSEINNTGFYLREVLLFKVFWLCFIPFSYLTFFLSTKVNAVSDKKSVRLTLLILLVLVVLTAHILLSSFLISTLGNLWQFFEISTWRLATTKLVDYLGVACLFYVLAMWVAEYTARTTERLNKQNKEPQKKEVKVITIRDGKKVIPIPISDIKWIESDKPYVAIQTEEERYLHSSTLKEILDELDNSNFARIHRSTIVNLSKIEKLVSRLNGDYDVLMNDGKELRLSRNYKKKLDAKLF